MKTYQKVALTAGLALATLAPVASAGPTPQRSPNIGYVYPAGGRQGTTFQAAISGQYLDGLTNVVISGEGVRATIVEHVKPLNGRVLNLLRDRLRNLQSGLKSAKKGDGMVLVRSELNTNEVQRMSRAAAEKELGDIRYKLSNPKNQRPPNPQLAEDVKLRFVVDADAKSGDRELRLMTALGLSNPVRFRVGQLPEFSKRAEVSLSGPRNTNPARLASKLRSSAPEPEMRVTLPCVVNGQIMPGAVDRVRFNARKGQPLVVVASARELIPYMADAVPGWFQATLALYDSRGKELAYDDDFRFNPDPVLYFEIPADGDYALEIKDAIYRGREDFVYRITLGELPFITSIFPLGGKAGEQTTVELKGWNLPSNTLTMDARDKGPGTYPLSVRKEDLVSNRVPFGVDTLPESLEKEPNNSPASAQAVTLPLIVNGRIEQPGDSDVFRFEGRGGDVVVAEVLARRLNSPLDSVLKLTDASGKQLAFNDDYEDKGAGLTTHHADSYLMVTLPADGTCYLHLGDVQGKGGPEYGYRLRLSAPRPDFALRVAPASITVRGGFSGPVTVYAIRKDGFSNDIALVLKDAPMGLRLNGSRLPADTNQVRVTLSALAALANETVNISLEGRATIQGRQVVHPAVPAEDMMQAFAYRHLVPMDDLKVAVVGRPKGFFPGAKAGGSKTTKKKKSQ